jgi:thiamine biosynthesis lipoprotein ApbE
MGGTGPCDFFAPSGHVNPAKARRLERAIRAYEHALARSCARVRQCTFDGGAFGRIVDRRTYYGADHNHLSVQGHAKVADVAWRTLVRNGALPRP